MSTLITDLKGNSKAILAESGRNDNDLVVDEKVAIERLGASKLHTDSVCKIYIIISNKSFLIMIYIGTRYKRKTQKLIREVEGSSSR